MCVVGDGDGVGLVVEPRVPLGVQACEVAVLDGVGRVECDVVGRHISGDEVDASEETAQQRQHGGQHGEYIQVHDEVSLGLASTAHL